MVGDIKNWLKDRQYNFCTFPTLGSKLGKSATIGVALTDPTPYKCRELFKQIEKWVAHGADGFELIEVANVIYATFDAPLDTIYRLIFTINGVKHCVYEATNVNEVRGDMLEEFLMASNNKDRIVGFATIERDKARVSFIDKKSGGECSLDWKITSETVPFCG